MRFSFLLIVGRKGDAYSAAGRDGDAFFIDIHDANHSRL
jgi:hypothetical protein